LLLRRLDDLGLTDATVAGRPAAEVRAELTAYATELAERFDARNGTTHQSEQVRAMLSARPVVDHLPLTPHARRPAAPPPPPPPAPVQATDPDELLAAAEEHWDRREAPQALAAWVRFDDLASEETDTPLRSARRSDGAGLERFLSGDLDGAIAVWQDTAKRYEALGDEERRQSALGRIGALLVQRGDETGVAMVETAAEYLEGHATIPRLRTAALLRLAAVRTDLDRPSDALEVLSRAEPGPGVESERARAYVELGDREQAVAATRRACDGYRASGRRALLTDALLRLGELLSGGPDEDTAGEVYTEAITSCPPDQEFMRLAAHACRGNWLFSRDRPAEAVEDLVEAVAGFTAMGAQPQAAYARRDLSRAYYEAGRHLEAAEAAEEAIPLFERFGDRDAANGCRFVLGHAQRQLGETEPAAATFTALAEARTEEFPGHAAELLENAGELLSGADKDVLAAERYAAAAVLHRGAEDALSAVSADRRHAMCLFYAGSPDDALEVIARVRAELDAVADGEQRAAWERAALCFDEARVLAATGRFEEAKARAEEARELFGTLDAADAVASCERLLDDIGQAAAAEG
jgi:tetratricopeptide (TPR) repeat protein